MEQGWGAVHAHRRLRPTAARFTPAPSTLKWLRNKHKAPSPTSKTRKQKVTSVSFQKQKAGTRGFPYDSGDCKWYGPLYGCGQWQNGGATTCHTNLHRAKGLLSVPQIGGIRLPTELLVRIKAHGPSDSIHRHRAVGTFPSVEPRWRHFFLAGKIQLVKQLAHM